MQNLKYQVTQIEDLKVFTLLKKKQVMHVLGRSESNKKEHESIIYAEKLL